MQVSSLLACRACSGAAFLQSILSLRAFASDTDYESFIQRQPRNRRCLGPIRAGTHPRKDNAMPGVSAPLPGHSRARFHTRFHPPLKPIGVIVMHKINLAEIIIKPERQRQEFG